MTPRTAGSGQAGPARSPAAPSRRSFLVAAGGMAGAGAVGALTGACAASGRPSGHRPGPSGGHSPRRSPSPAPLRNSDWAALGQRLSSGRLVRPGDADYASARRLFDPRFDGLHPAAIAYCAIPGDVSACLRFARTFGLPVAARAGGHSYAGWSSTPGLIIDVSMMSAVRLDPSSQLATVGAGARLVDLYAALAGAGRAVPGGSCPTVGLAGLALGGGVGVTSRLFGLTCDNVAAVQLVTADGTVRSCGPASNPDLYWACRGGGGGNFGVVTAFTLRTHPAPDLVLFFLQWPWSRAAAVISAWQSWAPAAPDPLWSNMHLSAAPGGSTPSVSVGGTFAGSVGGAEVLLGKLYAAAGSQPDSSFIRREPFLSAMLVDAGCASLSVAQCHLPSQNLAGMLRRQPERAKSAFFDSPIPAAGLQVLLAGVERMQRVAASRSSSGGVAFDAFGGAINRVSPAATAFVHRSALFLAQYTTTSPQADAAGRAGASRQADWLRAFHGSMQPYAGGHAYQNYIDPDLRDWQHAYYGANYARLQRVKAAVDRDDVFRFPQSVELPAQG